MSILSKVLYRELNGYFYHEKAGNKNKCSFRNIFNLICTQSKYLSRGAYKLTKQVELFEWLLGKET